MSSDSTAALDCFVNSPTIYQSSSTWGCINSFRSLPRLPCHQHPSHIWALLSMQLEALIFHHLGWCDRLQSPLLAFAFTLPKCLLQLPCPRGSNNSARLATTSLIATKSSRTRSSISVLKQGVNFFYLYYVDHCPLYCCQVRGSSSLRFAHWNTNYDGSKPFRLHHDACINNFGATFEQGQPGDHVRSIIFISQADPGSQECWT